MVPRTKPVYRSAGQTADAQHCGDLARASLPFVDQDVPGGLRAAKYDQSDPERRAVRPAGPGCVENPSGWFGLDIVVMQ